MDEVSASSTSLPTFCKPGLPPAGLWTPAALSALAGLWRAEAEGDALQPLGLSGPQVLGDTTQSTNDVKLVLPLTLPNATPWLSHTKDM